MTNPGYDFRLICDFEMETITVEFNVTGKSLYYDLWKYELEEAKRLLNSGNNNYKFVVENLERCLAFGLKENIQIKGHLRKNVQNGQLYLNLLKEIPNINETEFGDSGYSDFLTANDNFRSYIFEILGKTIDDFEKWVNNEETTTIEAHSVTRSLVYNISDKNDYMAQTILNYMNENIIDSDPEKQFITKWMMKFEMGKDFVIDSYGGESYKLEIIENADYPEERTPLLDKGVGSNQLMILLLHLAQIMHSNRGSVFPPIVIIEEPEQNLHPKLQSMLADLFFEVYQYPKTIDEGRLGIPFVVETHSEYLVRRTQRLVAEKMYKSEEELKKDNPFEIIYCPRKGKPYNMGYNIYGHFIDTFDEGFFDVASKDAIAVSKMERARK